MVDLIINATGYDVDLPFPGLRHLRPERQPDAADPARGFSRRNDPGLWFIGFVDTIGASIPLYELQAEWVGDVLTAKLFLRAVPPCASGSTTSNSRWAIGTPTLYWWTTALPTGHQARAFPASRQAETARSTAGPLIGGTPRVMRC